MPTLDRDDMAALAALMDDVGELTFPETFLKTPCDGLPARISVPPSRQKTMVR